MVHQHSRGLTTLFYDVNSRINNYVATPMHSHPHCVKSKRLKYSPKMNTIRVQLATLRVKKHLIKEYLHSIYGLITALARRPETQ